MTKKRIIRYFLLGAGFLCALLSLALILLLRNGPGQALLAAEISRLASTQASGVEIEGLSGSLPDDIRIGRLVLSDAKGPWLTAKNVDLKWSMLALLAKKVHVRLLAADEIDFARAPESAPKEKEPKSGPPSLDFNLPRLALDELDLRRVALGGDLLGQDIGPAVLTAGGKAVDDGQGNLASHFEVRRTDGPGLSAVLDANIEAASVLDLKLDAREEAGGVLAKLAKLPTSGPLTLTLAGKGPLTAWSGTLNAEAQGFGTITSTITLAIGAPRAEAAPGASNQAAEDIRFKADGSVGFAPGALPQNLEPIAGDGARFALEGGHDEAGRLRLDQASLEAPDLSLKLSGTLALATSTLDAAYALRADDLSRLSSLAGTALAGRLRADGSAKGPLDRLHAALHVEGESLAADEARIAKAVLDLGADFPPSPETGVDVTADGKLAGVAYKEPLPEPAVTIALAARIAGSDDIRVANLEVKSDSLHLGLTGGLSPASAQDSAVLTLSVKDLRPYARLAGSDAAGSLQARAQLAGKVKNGEATIKAEGKAESLSGLPASLSALLGRAASFSAAATLAKENDLRLKELTLSGDKARLKAEGAYDLSKKNFSAQASLGLADLSGLSSAAGMSLGGKADLDLKAQGTASDLRAEASLTGKDILAGERTFQTVTARLRAQGPPASPQGDLSLAAQRGDLGLEGSTRFALKDPVLRLENLVVRARGTTATGRLALNLKTRLADGTLQADSGDLSPIGSLLAVDLGGSLKLSLALAAPKGKQGVTADLSAKGLRLAGVAADSITARAGFEDVLNTPKGNAVVNAAGVTASGTRLDTLRASASGGTEALRFDVQTAGRTIQPFTLAAAGRYQVQAGVRNVSLETLTGKFGTYPLRLSAPALLRLSPDAQSLESLRLEIGPGRVAGDYRLVRDALQATADVKALPMQFLHLFGGPPLAGTLTASLRASGTAASPAGQATLAVRGVRLDDPAYASLPPIGLAADAALQGGGLTATLDIQGLGGGKVHGEMATRAAVSLSPMTFVIPRDAALSGGLAANLDLSRLASALPLQDQRIAGRLNADMRFAGTVGEPLVDGRIQLADGSYENGSSGTVLRNIAMTAVTSGRELVIKSLTATDGGSGTIAGNGKVLFSPADSFPFKLDVEAKNARLVRIPAASGSVSGTVSFAGDMASSLLSGALTVGPAEIAVPESSPAPEVTKLEVIDVNGPAARGKKKQAGAVQGPSMAQAVRMDLKVDIPGRVFVRGRGLDSEWKGNLRVTGTAASPVIVGQIDLVRGQFTFLDRRFTLERGAVYLDGSTPPKPTLDVVAQATIEDFTAQVNISGQVDNPNISLTSDPVQPQDEVMSRILFGRSMKDISPLQALQLARAVASLARGNKGEGQGLLSYDYIGNTRKFLRLDELQIGQATTTASTLSAPTPPPGSPGYRKPQENTGTAVGVGKYLTEDVFIRAEQGIGTNTTKFTLEYDITPHISLESDVGTGSSTASGTPSSGPATGVGLNWKFDY